MILSCVIRNLLVLLRSQTRPLIFVSFATSRYFYPSRLSSPSIHIWSELENTPPSVTALIISALPCWELSYLSFSDVARFRRTSLATLIGIVLRVPTMGERVFVFPKKRQGKKVSWIIFYTPTNVSPMSKVTCYRNIHSSWIACTTMEYLSWGYLPAVSLIMLIFFSHVSVQSIIQSRLDLSSLM